MRLLNGILKWIISLATALSAGLLIIIFLSPKPELGDFILRLILLAAVGFFGGLTARFLFRKIPVLFTIFLVMVSNLLAVLTIDHFYINTYQFKFLTADFQFIVPTISDGSQFIFITLVLLLPLLAFRRMGKKSAKQNKTPKPKRARKSISQTLQPITVKIDPRNWQLLNKIKIVTKKQFKSTSSEPKKPALLIARSSVSKKVSQPVTIRKKTQAKPLTKKLKIPSIISNGGQNDVKLVGEEDHVCPYCLEEVVNDDSRGVKVCPECGTWHHQDCWSQTGSCGVAHRTEL